MEEDRKSGAESRVSGRTDEADVEGHVVRDVALEPEVASRNEGADDEPDVEGHAMRDVAMEPGRVSIARKAG